jgi:D-alanine-D-alanine ligase
VSVQVRATPRIAVIFNRDFEGADADPENRAREDIRGTAHDVVAILESLGCDTRGIGVTGDVLAAMREILDYGPTAIFNLCESIEGDNRFESLLPLLFDLQGIPYTGSGPLALTLALHKDRAKDVLRSRGVPTPGAVVLRTPAAVDEVALPFPLIVKPTREDASVGISSASVVHDADALAARVRLVLEHYQQPVLVEQFVHGREIYVSMLGRVAAGPQIFPFFEIDFSDLPRDRPRIVSFEGKWVEDSLEFKGTRPVPCEGLSVDLRDRILRIALAAFEAMEIRDYGRLDFRLAEDGTPYVIDVNPNCDLSAEAGGFSRAARAAGLSYDQVILRLLELAMSRQTHASAAPTDDGPTRPARAHRSGGGEPVQTRGGGLRARAPRGGPRSS